MTHKTLSLLTGALSSELGCLTDLMANVAAIVGTKLPTDGGR